MARSPRSRRARRTGASRPRTSSAPAAGRRRAARRPRSSAAKSPRSCRKTLVLTSLSSELPAASRIAARFRSTCSVCVGDVALDRRVARLEAELAGDEDELADADRLVVGRTLERCRSVLGADRRSCPWRLPHSSRWMTVQRVGERDAERLEDRLEDVVGVLALDQPDVERQRRPPRRARRGIAPRGRSRARRAPVEVGVRGDERPCRTPRRRPSRAPRPTASTPLPCAPGREERRAAPARALRRRRRPRPPARPGSISSVRSKLARGARARPSRWSSSGHAGRDVRRPCRVRRGPVQPCAPLTARRARSSAPSARSRSSMRS